jgi:nucleotide-binding universal stress UspA family protein
VRMMKILLAYDGFERSRPALEEATRVANGGDTVTVFSVVPPDAQASKSGGHVGMAPHAHEDVALGHKYLREHGVEAEMKIEHGDPAEKILEEARAGQYDLIVTGTRGRGPLVRSLFGSVSHEVADNAPCTLLIVSEDRVVRIEPRVVAKSGVPLTQ